MNNTANGAFALVINSTGNNNTAVGDRALQSNTASNNTANGANALFHNTTGTDNTANGAFALVANTTGGDNTANGFAALGSNTTGSSNTANGDGALGLNTTGVHNTAVGSDALAAATTNTDNTAASNNTAVGFQAGKHLTTGSNNIALGYEAGINQTTGSSNIYIGDVGAAGESNIIAIGRPTVGSPPYTFCFIGGIFNASTFGTGLPVYCFADGQLSTQSSSRTFKDGIKRMGQASEALLALKPVTFHYKKDTTCTPQFGLVAEEVEKVNPDLIVRDKEGKTYGVRYDAVNAMLLNEFLKEHTKVEKLKKDFESKIALQQKQIEALTAGLQKVSAQLELSKGAPQTVLNNQ
jgi:hypothetical protein